MKAKPNLSAEEQRLQEGLTRLGIRELEERLEFSPLLAERTTGGGGGDGGDVGATICCTCKIPGPDIPEDGVLPYGSETMDFLN